MRAIIMHLLVRSVAGSCGVGWSEGTGDWGSKCYRMSSTSVMGSDCELACHNLDPASEVVCVETDAENAFIYDTFCYGTGSANECSSYTNMLFIGLYQDPTHLGPSTGWDNWRNGCGSHVRNWRSGEPNHFGGVEDCTVMGYGGFMGSTPSSEWDSIACTVRAAPRCPFCQRPLHHQRQHRVPALTRPRRCTGWRVDAQVHVPASPTVTAQLAARAARAAAAVAAAAVGAGNIYMLQRVHWLHRKLVSICGEQWQLL